MRISRRNAEARVGRPVIAPPTPAASAAGFSLLEVLIAIAILALAVTLSIPSMSAMRERHQTREAFAAVNAWITEQRTTARLYGAPADHPVGPLPAPSMPQNWSATFLTEWRLYPSGACAEAMIRITSARGRTWERGLTPADCRIELRVNATSP